MQQKLTSILQVSASDIGGGAEKIAYDLYRSYQIRGYNSFLAVGEKILDEANVLLIPNDNYKPWKRFWFQIADQLTPNIGIEKREKLMRRFLKYVLAQPQRFIKQRLLGYEYFDLKGTQDILNLPPTKPSILHCHNLHGNYFDLRLIPKFSQELPLILTLHDAWLLSGRCAHSFDCDRWQTGCGNCPDLTIPPKFEYDNSAYNWQRKQKIYQNSKLYIATPSQWLMDKVKKSILNTAVLESRVIPNGVDLSIFYPSNKVKVRTELDIPINAKVILFAANGIRKNYWKDYQTMQTSVALLAERLPNVNILFIALGEESPSTKIGQAIVKFVPYTKDPRTVAKYYQSADVYIHAARADTFPNVVLEALACGTPVVATKVGGIAEQIENGKTGFLVSVGDALAMADSVQNLIVNDTLYNQISEQAAQVADKKFSLERMVDDYLGWYQHILNTINTTRQ